MVTMNRLTQGLDFHGQVLSLRSERQRMIASNIANADTPGYVARDMDFAKSLTNARAHAGLGQTVKTVRPDHLAIKTDSRPPTTIVYARPSQANLDGNSVDMDRERASFADNAVKYEAALRFINGSVRTMLDAMKAHHQG